MAIPSISGVSINGTISVSDAKNMGTAASKVAVLADDGELKYRTVEELVSDMEIDSVVKASSVAVSWTSDTTTMDGFSYKGTIILTGCTTAHSPIVTFAPALAESGDYCPVAESGTDCVYVWAKTNKAVTVDVTAVKGVASMVQNFGASISWSEDTTVSGYSYKGTVELTGCTDEYMPLVTLSAADAASGTFCPVAESRTDCVYVWCKKNTAQSLDVVAVK